MFRGVEFTLAVGAYEGATREAGMKRQSKVTRGHSCLCFLTVQDQTVNHVSQYDSADTEIQHNLFMIVQGREVTANYLLPPPKSASEFLHLYVQVDYPPLVAAVWTAAHTFNNQWPTLFTSDRVTPVCPTNTSARPVHLQLMPSFQASARGGAIQLFA